MRGLFDYEYQLELINKHQPPLQKLDKVIDWEVFRTTLEEAFAIEAKAPGGRPPFDRVMMFKIVILQRYYNLSDEQTKFQIKDRLSFQQFLGLQIGDKVPDEKTIWLFKEQLKEKKLSKKLFELFIKILISNGIIAKEGSIVDASFVNVPINRNTREENETLKQGNIPESFESNPAKTKLITKFTTTTANVHDSQALEEIVNRDDKRLFADSAYSGKTIQGYLNFKNVKNFIHEKGYRNSPLNFEQMTKNTLKSKVRSRVEHVFGFMTNSMNNGLNLRAIGKKRIDSLVALLNLTYNMCRYEQLVRLQKIKII